MNSRTAYDGGTPDRATFSSSPSTSSSPPPSPPQSPSSPSTAVFIPAPAPVDDSLDASLSRGAAFGRRGRAGALRAKAVDAWRTVVRTVKNNTGMLLVAASQCFFSLMNVSVKKLNSLDPPVPAFELIWVRMAITWICCVTYMSVMKVPDPWLGPKGVRLLLAARGFVGFFGLFGIYFSLQYLSLSDATVLTFLAPLCTAGTAAVFLGERLTWRQVGAGVCSLAGVVLIARPEFLFGRAALETDIPLDLPAHFNATAAHLNATLAGVNGTVAALNGNGPGGAGVTPAQRVMAVGVAMIGVLGATGAYTTIRAIGKRAHPLHNLVSFSSQCVIVSTVAIIAMRVPVVIPTRLDWLAMLLMIGLFGFCAQFLLTLGLQRETAGRGTMAVYVQIIFATLFERIFFHTTPPPLSILGTIIIMSSAIYVAVTKKDASTQERTARPAEDISMEEGLLANQEEDHFVIEADEKDSSDDDQTLVASPTSPSIPSLNSTPSGKAIDVMPVNTDKAS